ncbi:MAG TPA: 30S ribosomal protein S12 methylthiotransferase RimO [Sediminispirochaeta sp.]|nr:30S ribosomal protein S12 methylthiotransferase RimO [Sediminispirochaeta sp.]
MQESNNKTFYIERLGCAKNQVDAEFLYDKLINAGWTYSEKADEAELIIVNTCGFIQSAKEESLETTLEARRLYPGKKILLAGCLAQRYGQELAHKLPELDGVFGNHDLDQIVSVADQVVEGARPVHIPEWSFAERRRSRLFSSPNSAYVKISEGCNHFCSFCAIPIIRGPLKSAALESVVDEIKGLLDRGVVELNLIAQDLASFGSDRGVLEFPLLLRKISELPGDFWLRLLYIHPDSFPIEILSIMRDDPRILPYFDIPFQHASSKILSSMGRVGSATGYLKLIDRVRNELPDAVLRTSFLVGYPGEGKKEFQELKRFQKDVAFDWAGVFVYSREEGTRSFRMGNPLSRSFQHRRAEGWKKELEELQREISGQRMHRFLNRQLRVLVEEKVEGEDLALGRAYLQAPEVDGVSVILSEAHAPGEWIDTRVVKVNNFDLEVEPLDE